MADSTIHITNGDSFTDRLKNLNPPGDIMTWREMLCEGPVVTDVFSDEFIKKRSSFINSYAGISEIEINYEGFAFDFRTLNFETYKNVILWFEYDLFCHINLATVVWLLSKYHNTIPLFLVCSGVIEGQEGLYGLGELTDKQILDQAKNLTRLEEGEIATLCQFWEYYASNNHQKLHNLEINQETLPYLKDCIQAHFERFPNELTGINALELKVLKVIAENEFNSERQLLAFLLKNQGYYGFGDLQWEKVITAMKPFFTEVLNLELTKKGEAVLNGSFNVFSVLKDKTVFGGASKYNYFYNTKTQQLSIAHE